MHSLVLVEVLLKAEFCVRGSQHNHQCLLRRNYTDQVSGLMELPQTPVPLVDCDGFKDDTSGPQLTDHPEACTVAQESVHVLVSSAAIKFRQSCDPHEMDQKDYSAWLPKGLEHKNCSSSRSLRPPKSASSHKAWLQKAGNSTN